MKKILIILYVFVFAANLSAQTWEVSEDKKAKVSPFKFTQETVAKGQDIFKRNCSSCHGEPTKGNFQPLVPSPGDPATDKFQKQTDGALFYKITTGRSPMPAFKEVLTSEERWSVISYFRSFNKNYVQPEVEEEKEGQAKPILITTYDSVAGTLLITATDTLKNPLKGASVSFLAKRYFGNLPLGEHLTTNENGQVFINLPKDLPGDKNGMVTVIVKLTSDKEGDSQKSVTLAIGIPTNKPPLTLPRAMWNVGAKAPVWLLLSYTTVVFVIWGFLGYIIYMLVKLKKAKNENPE